MGLSLSQIEEKVGSEIDARMIGKRLNLYLLRKHAGIISRRNEGFTYKMIGEEFGISTGRARQIVCEYNRLTKCH